MAGTLDYDEDEDVDGPRRGATAPDVDKLLPHSDAATDNLILFLERLADGWGEFEAGLSAPLGWSPAQIKRTMSQPEIQELIWAIRERDNESVERAIRRTAIGGNPTSQKLWAYNKMAHRGWADRKNVRIEGEINHDVVHSVKAALEQQTRQLVEANALEGIEALQQAIGLDVDEADVIDAEIITE